MLTKPYIKLIHNTPAHENWIVINWCLGNFCNYSCSYCPTGLHDGSKMWPDKETVKLFISRVAAHHYPKKVYFEFTGGEVTLWRHFAEVCQYCTELGVSVGCISNASRTLRWWQENKQFINHACLSFHPEHANADHFIDVVKEVHLDLRTHVNIMMSPDKFDYCFDVAQRAVALGDISIALQPLIHDFGDTLYDYTPEQLHIFDQQHELCVKKIVYTKSFDYYRGAMKQVYADGTSVASSAHRFISDKTNDWSGWKCYAGVEQLIVDMDGTIYRGWCKVGNALGHINDEILTLPTDPIVCNKTMCHCNFDIMSTKERV